MGLLILEAFAESLVLHSRRTGELRCGTDTIRATMIAIVATPGTVSLVAAAARAIAIGIRNATLVTYSRRISTSHVEASGDRFGSAAVCTRSTAPRAARWRRS